ncbi:MAG: MBL fold metallo-hydrolase, partial [Myxococcales bacterium]
DPGAHDPREQARLTAFLMGLTAEGKRLRAIVLTHHHADHVGAAGALKERLKLPIWAHELTANRVPGVERILTDGEELTLAGKPPLKLKVLHTPGHARGHIVLQELESRALICGDMVAGVGTIIIDPPEGDLTDYLASLERMIAVPAGVLYPAHGPPIVEGVQKLREYVLHRQMREARVHAAVKARPRSIQEIVREVYTDTPPELHALAERSALASLIKLIRDGKVTRQGERYGAAQ